MKLCSVFAFRAAPARHAALLLAALLGACATGTPSPDAASANQRSVQIQRTTFGVAHIEAADFEALAYGVAYAHAEDNFCQTADHLVTVRGERSRFFGPQASGLLGLRTLPNEQIDIYIRGLMDDGELALADSRSSDDAKAMARGYVAGYNRFLKDRVAAPPQANPPACAGQPWLRPMSLADYRRMGELMVTQAGVAAFADAVVAARLPQPGSALPEPAASSPGPRQPARPAAKDDAKPAVKPDAGAASPTSPANRPEPKPKPASQPQGKPKPKPNAAAPAAAKVATKVAAKPATQPVPRSAPIVSHQPALPTAVAASASSPGSLESPTAYRLADLPPGSNGWAFGAESSLNGRGVLMGNPHFPWSGVNRFWQLHLTIPGKLDVMGASIGHAAVVQIGFNQDVAWTHTVSTGKRFTLHELKLVEGDPASYLVSGQPERMRARTVRYDALKPDGTLESRLHTVWMTRFGPVVSLPRAGLGWTPRTAYALQDSNTWNVRAPDTWLALNRATSVAELQAALRKQGIPWVNTIAADRHGDALYADASAVPDVDAEHLKRCAPSKPAAALFASAGLVVLDGSRSDCQWRKDPAATVPGLIPMERLPTLVRRDWVQNANDSFWLSNPSLALAGISPLVGAIEVPQRLRTRAGITQIMDRLAGEDGLAPHGKVGLAEVQAMLLMNRNHAAALVLDDLLAACARLPGSAANGDRRDGCHALTAWDRRNDLTSRGAHLFREWWRLARETPGLWRQAFNANDPVRTPAGLKMSDAKVSAAIFTALDKAVAAVRAAGFALDAPLGDVQHRSTAAGAVPLHGGDEIEGVLNKIEPGGDGRLGPGGYEAQQGSSYLQAVTFDERGPVAEGLLTYGQASAPESPRAFEPLPLFSRKEWPVLPFHAEDVLRARVGEPLLLLLEAPPAVTAPVNPIAPG